MLDVYVCGCFMCTTNRDRRVLYSRIWSILGSRRCKKFRNKIADRPLMLLNNAHMRSSCPRRCTSCTTVRIDSNADESMWKQSKIKDEGAHKLRPTQELLCEVMTLEDVIELHSPYMPVGHKHEQTLH